MYQMVDVTSNNGTGMNECVIVIFPSGGSGERMQKSRSTGPIMVQVRLNCDKREVSPCQDFQCPSTAQVPFSLLSLRLEVTHLKTKTNEMKDVGEKDQLTKKNTATGTTRKPRKQKQRDRVIKGNLIQ